MIVYDIFDVWDATGKHLAGVIVPVGTPTPQVKRELLESGEYGTSFSLKRYVEVEVNPPAPGPSKL